MKTAIFIVLSVCIMTGALAQQDSEPSAEPLVPELSNSRFSAPYVRAPPKFCLDNVAGKNVIRKYNLTKGQVQISFNVKLTSRTPGRKAVVRVEWNGKTIHTILACDNGKSVKLQVDARDGLNTLKFCALGGTVCQVCICDLCAIFKRCCAAWGKDVICNGGFEQNCCGSAWCVWNQGNFSKSFVPNWIPCPEIEIGRGSNYNTPALGANNWVVQLDAYCNTCIKQRILIGPGKYRLKYDYAARLTKDLESSSFVVKLNGKVIKTICPKDYSLHSQVFEFTLKSCPKESFLEFCGAGTSDSYGAAIDNVKLETYDQCADVQIVKLT